MREMQNSLATAEFHPVVGIFCRYAHENKNHRVNLERALSALKYQGYINVWCDREILPGMLWDHEIHKHIESSDLFLPLVSSYFLSSRYCWGVEMQHALERWKKGEVAIVPILVSPVDYSGTPISHLRMLPEGRRAITQWPNRELAYDNVAKGIRKEVYRLRAQKLKLQGDAYCRQETYDDALDAYNQALGLDPENPPFYYAQGKALYHLRRFEEAIEAYEQAIALKPDYGLAYQGLGDALRAFAEHARDKYLRLADESYKQYNELKKRGDNLEAASILNVKELQQVQEERRKQL